MVKGGETLGNEEGSEETGEEEEVIPAMYCTPGVRPLTPGVGISLPYDSSSVGYRKRLRQRVRLSRRNSQDG